MTADFRILLVDDHGLFSDALSSVLGRLGGAVEVSAVRSCEGALETLERSEPFQLVLLDLDLPGLKRRAAFDAVRNKAGETPIVIVTGTEPGLESLELLRAGARGYVYKGASADDLISVLKFVLAGGTHIPAVALQAHGEPGAAGVSLTGRQREVLTLLARGRSNRDIATALGISEATVRVHVSSVMRVLGVENRTQAATSGYARRLAHEE